MTDVRPILSAADLRITPAEHQAMLEVRAHFAAGTFHHDHEAAADMPDGFNMDYADRETECGTVQHGEHVIEDSTGRYSVTSEYRE
jgi:hypothetical protein